MSIEDKRKSWRRSHAWLAKHKMTLVCEDCGWRPKSEAETVALHFDHVDPATKTVGVSSLRNRAKILAEIQKCEPRCANCHAIRTAREGHNRHRRNG